MTNRSRRTRAARARLAVCVGVAGGLAFCAVGMQSGAETIAPETRACAALRRVLRHDVLYMSAVLANRATVPTVIAAREGAGAGVAAMIEGLGGRVEYRDDAVGYVRATLPVAEFATLACSEGVDALEVDGGMATEDLTLPRGPLTDALVPADPLRSFEGLRHTPPPARHQPTTTVPLHEMGVDRFLREHPTADGRGVTIAFVEWVPDLLDVAAWRTASQETTVLRPVFDWPAAPHRNVVPLTEITVDEGATAVFNGQPYRVPDTLRDRVVWVGTVDERSFDGYYSGDLNRDGNREAASPYLGVLRDPVTQQLWVDVQQNRDWTDDTPFVCGSEPGVTLGHDDPRTPQRDSVAILILCDQGRHAEVLVVPTANRHITTLVATAAGAALPRGGHGIAPGARILPVLQFDTGRTSRLIEACLVAFRDSRADLLTMGLSVQRRVHDGRSVPPLILDRAVRHYDKLLFSAMGNGPIGLETLSEAATPSEVVSVGAYASPETVAATHGIPDAQVERPYWLGMHGPRADGQLKPDLIASAVAYVPSSSAWAPSPFTQVAESAGERPAWGTSLSAPAAAAAAALLLSAARQTGLAPSRAALRSALLGSARPVPGYGLAEQGNGLLSVPAAWEALRRGVHMRHIEMRAPVVTRLVSVGDLAAEGPAMYEREGWTTRDIGRRQVRAILLTRRDGPAVPERFHLSVIGDRETFDAPAVVMLPRNTPISLPVTVTPHRRGQHSAIVRLTDAAGVGWAQLPMTIVVADDLALGAVTLRGAVPFAYFDRYFMRVPPEMESLSVEADGVTAGIRPQLLNPAGQAAPFAWGTEQGPWRYAVERPEPGVWELVLANSEGASFGLATGARPTRASYTVTVRAAGMVPQTATPSRTVTSPGVLTDHTPFTLNDFYVARDHSTVALTSEVPAGAGCAAEHRVILARCERDACVPALASDTTAGGATLRALHVSRGLWRGVIWRTTPASCRQRASLRVTITEGAESAGGTARREP